MWRGRMWYKTLKMYCALFLMSAVFFAVYADDNSKIIDKNNKIINKTQSYNLNRDIAFVSVMGSRPDSKQLHGFQKAVLYNALGAKVKEITLSQRDSIFSLDKMIQENKGKGPLFIKMYR
jgi:hypothetical protein